MAQFDNLPKTGYTKDSAKGFLLNAGALLKNLTFKEGKWSGELLGATSGGSSISLVNTFRQPEIDGVFTTPVGADSIETSEGKFEVNMIEWTAENIKMAILGEIKASDGTDFPAGYDVITTRRKVEESDYIENLGYIGTISGSEKPIIIIMHHSIVTSGLEFEPQDKQEGIYKMVFEARSGADEVNDTSLPITILFPTAATADGKKMSINDVNSKVDGVEKEEKGATK